MSLRFDDQPGVGGPLKFPDSGKKFEPGQEVDMRIPAVVSLLILALLLVAACGSTEPSPTPRRNATDAAVKRLKPGDVKPVTEPTSVTWHSFKTVNARTGKKMLSQMHLINKAHPDAKRPIPLNAHKKVLSNQQMGAVLAVLNQKGYGKHAKSGMDAARVPKNTANGVIVIKRGTRTWGLVFQKGQQYGASAVPAVYLECKKLIFDIFSTADQFQVYTSDKDRVLGIQRIPSGVGR
jgi:hypothetical protein